MRNLAATEVLRSLLALAAVTCVSCSGADENIATPTSPGMTWQELRASAWTAPNGKLVVEGDLSFATEDDLYRFWEEDRSPHSGEKLTIATRTVGGVSVDDRWAFPDNLNLTYCVGSGFSASQLSALLPALDQAAEAWSRIAAVSFERVNVATCNSSTTSVVFDVQTSSGSFNGLAFFPGDPRSLRTLFLTNASFTTTEGGRTLLGIVTHELGHTIGFRHEHIWTDPSCTGETENSESLGARQVTDVDELSVMFYPQCRTPQGGGYALTQLDRSGSVSIYGLAPALTSTVVARL